MTIDAGIYLNMFEVDFEDCNADLMCVDGSKFPKLRELRNQLADETVNAQVYPVIQEIDATAVRKIYGYGPEQNRLDTHGFQAISVRVHEIPQLASRMILDGYIEHLGKAGYTCRWSFGRAFVYQFKTPVLTTNTGVRLIEGFELQSLYLVDPERDILTYGIVVNGLFTYRDKADKPLNTREVVSRFGSETLRKLRIRQGDLAPFGKVNLEVSRQRLVEMTLPFVTTHSSFNLPCGIPAQLRQQPMRVVLAGQEP